MEHDGILTETQDLCYLLCNENGFEYDRSEASNKSGIERPKIGPQVYSVVIDPQLAPEVVAVCQNSVL